MKTIIRISSIEIHNLKNTVSGRLVMPHTKDPDVADETADILGIYGQNGSGKTAVIDALYLLQYIMSGKSLPDKTYEYILHGCDTMTLTFVFQIHGAEKEFLVDASFTIGKSIDIDEDNSIVSAYVQKEVLSASIQDKNNYKRKTAFIKCDLDDSGIIFEPSVRLQEVISGQKADEKEKSDENIKTDIIVAKKLARANGRSFIFSKEGREILLKQAKTGFEDYSLIIKSLFDFALMDLFVINNSHSAIISTDMLLPMAFRISLEEQMVKGDFAIRLDRATVVNDKLYEVLKRIIAEINVVLCQIIPNMELYIKDNGTQVLDGGEMGHSVDLMSRRGRVEIPIRCESDGVIKIISILNAMITAFNDRSVFLAVDELDAGIYEYLLGEVLNIFSKEGKGQLLFTSHNLRPLEMLNKKCIIFSTANENKRYSHLKSVGTCNNLRDMYIRTITLGGQPDPVYDGNSSSMIAHAFWKAGKVAEN